jgi:hypothetical protein
MISLKEVLNSNIDAIFTGWIRGRNNEKLMATYDVIKKDHPLYKSTVSMKTLEKNHLRYNPPPEEK